MNVVRTLYAVATEGAALNFARTGSLVPVVIFVDAGGGVGIVGIAGVDSRNAAKWAREEARNRRAVAVAVAGEAWTAPVNGDWSTRARERPDRAEVVRVDVYTPTREYAWEAPILRDGTPRLGPFTDAAVTIAGAWARLLREAS